MRVAFLTVVLISVPTLVFADPDRRSPRGKPSRIEQGPRDDARLSSPPRNICPSRRAILDQERQRLDSAKYDLATIDSERAALQRRIEELTRRSDELRNWVKSQESRVASSEQAWKNECTSDDTCERYESLATDLDMRSAALDRDLNTLGGDLGSQARSVNDLRARIEPLQREYAEKQCNNLVPGATEQSTIDRCSAIFSDWNRLQSDLNRQNNQMFDMRARYDQMMSELRGLEQRGASVSTLLGQKCTASPKGQFAKNVETRRQHGQSVGQELDKIIDDIRKLRGITITVTTR